MNISGHYSNFRPVIKSVHSQEAYNNEILVLVTSLLALKKKKKSSGTRLFTIFLAPQEEEVILYGGNWLYRVFMLEPPSQGSLEIHNSGGGSCC